MSMTFEDKPVVPDPATWTGRHVLSLKKLKRGEKLVQSYLRDGPLIRRIDRALGYLKRRNERVTRSDS